MIHQKELMAEKSTKNGNQDFLENRVKKKSLGLYPEKTKLKMY